MNNSGLDIGKKNVRYYMEIEKYYITKTDRLYFVAFCQDVQPETLLKYGGFVSVDYFLAQFEKFLQEEKDTAQRIKWIRVTAKRANALLTWELIQTVATTAVGEDITNLGWDRVCKYIYDKSAEWGWDGYMEDGEKWHYSSLIESSASRTSSQDNAQPNLTKQNTSSNSSYTSNDESNSGSTSGGCYIATAVYGSYDCPEVWVLRRFRDHSLAKSIGGRLFIKLYYTVSPTLVKLFGDKMWFQQFWKDRLDKFVLSLKKKGYKDTPYVD